MNDNKKNNAEDKGRLEDMNDSSAAQKKEKKTGTAEDEGTLGNMNGEVEKKENF